MSDDTLSAQFKHLSGVVASRLGELDPHSNLHNSWLLSSVSDESKRRMFVFVAWAEEGSPAAEHFAHGLDEVRGAVEFAQA